MSNNLKPQKDGNEDQINGGRITKKYSEKFKELKQLTMDIKCVRQDISLSPSTRILFSNIVSLSYKTDYCWASNKYLAHLVGVCEGTLEKSMKVLKEKDLIISKETMSDKGTVRHISINYNEILSKYFRPEELNLEQPKKRAAIKQAIKKSLKK